MNIKRITALLLCLLLSLSLLASCSGEQNDPDENLGSSEEDEVNGPQTVAEHITAMQDTMEDKAYRITSTVAVSVKDQPAGEENKRVTVVTHQQGDDFALYLTATDTTPYAVYADGVLYAVEAQKKMTMTASDAKKLLSVGGFDEEWFSSFGFDSEWIGFSKGNPVINGKGTDSNNSAYVKIARSARVSFPTSEAFYVNAETLHGKLTMSAEDFRLMEQALSYDVEVYNGGDIALYHFDTTDAYEYGEDYAVSAPANAASYTAVTSTDELTA